MTKRITPRDDQITRRDQVISILASRVGRKSATTHDLLELSGFTIHWRRVTFSGGVGSWQWMPRRRKFRILVNATKSGYSGGHWSSHNPVAGFSMDVYIPGKRRGYCYGFCVEV